MRWIWRTIEDDCDDSMTFSRRHTEKKAQNDVFSREFTLHFSFTDTLMTSHLSSERRDTHIPVSLKKKIQNLVKYYLYISGDDHNSSTRNEELVRLLFFAVKMSFMDSSMITTCIQIRQWRKRVIKTRHLKCKRHQIEKTRIHLWRTDGKRNSVHFTCIFLLYQKTWLFDSWHWKISLCCHALRWHQRSSSIFSSFDTLQFYDSIYVRISFCSSVQLPSTILLKCRVRVVRTRYCIIT